MTWIICWYAFWDSRCFKKYLTFYANVSIVERQAVFGRAETCPPEPGRMKIKKRQEEVCRKVMKISRRSKTLRCLKRKRRMRTANGL